MRAEPVAIVTGAASGIGLNLSKLLISRGWRVAMADTNEKAGTAESAALGPQALFVRCDVSDWDSQSRMFEITAQKWGRIDFVAVNAGLPEQVPLMTVTGDAPKRPSTLVLDVDLKAVIYSVNLSLFYLRQNRGKGGKIVVTASQAGIYGFPMGPIYAAAKAGVSAGRAFFCSITARSDCFSAFIWSIQSPKRLQRRTYRSMPFARA